MKTNSFLIREGDLACASFTYFVIYHRLASYSLVFIILNTESHKGKNKRHRPNIKKQRQKIFKKLKEINDFIKDITGDDDGKNSQADTPSVEVESADFGEESGEAPMNNGKPTLDTSGVQFENQDALQPGINIFMDPSKFAGNKTVLSPDKNNALSTNSKTPPVQTVLLSPDSQAPNSAHADELNKDSDNLTKTSHADGLNKDSDNVGKAPNSVMEVVNPEVQKVNGPSKETPIGQLSASMTFGKPDLLEYSNQAKELLTNNNVLTALKAGLSNIIPQLKTSSSSSQAHFQEPLHKSDSTSVADRKQVTEDASITSSTPGMEQLIEPNYSSSPSSLTGDDSNVNGDMFNNEIDSLTNYAKQEIARNGNLSDATISKLVSTIKQKMDTGKHPDDKASVDSNVSYNHNSDGNYDNAVHAATLGAAGNHQERTTDSNNEVQNKDRAEFYDKIVSNIMNEIKKKLINEDKSSFRTDTKGVHNPVESFQERAETKSSTSSQEQMVPQFSQVKELAHTGLTHSYVNPSTLSPGAMQSTKIAVVSSKAVSGQENPQLTHSSSDLNDSNYLQSGAGIASGKTFSNEQLKSTHSTDNVLSSSQSYAFNAGSKDESKFINSHNSADISKAIPSNSVSGILLDTEGSIQEYHDDNIASQNPERKFLLGNRQNLSVISEQRIKENVTIPEYSSIRSNTGSNRKGAMSYQNIQKESKRIFDELQAQNKNYLSELNSKNEIDKLGPSGVSQKSRGPNGNISDRQVPVQTSDGVINRQFPSSTSDQTLAQSPGDTRAETKNVLPSAIEENLHSTPETKMQGYTDQLRYKY